MVQGVGCGVKGARVQGLGFRDPSLGCRVQRVQGSGFMIQGSGFRVQDSGFKVQRVQGLVSMEERTYPEHLHLDVALSNPPP
jgi:hypothetical protein